MKTTRHTIRAARGFLVPIRSLLDIIISRDANAIRADAKVPMRAATRAITATITPTITDPLPAS
jgi:hypothetical protein